MARHRSALRLAFAATVAMVWGTMVREPLPGLTAVLSAQILVGMPRPPRPRQAAALVVVIAATAGAAFAVSAVFSDRLLVLMAALGLLFFIGFAMRERAAGRPSLPATMLLNATAVVPVLTVQADILGAGVLETLVTAGNTRRLDPVRTLPGTAGRGRHWYACRRRACQWHARNGTGGCGAHPR